MEELILTDPVTTPAKTRSTYQVIGLVLNRETTVPDHPPGYVLISLRDNLGLPFNHQYTGQQAIDYMKFINTANFTTKSLHKRILERLSNEGVLPGTVTGTPDPAADEATP